jgi:hypothetical protein
VIKYLLKAKNVLIIPKSYNQDKLAQYQGRSKGHDVTSDGPRPTVLIGMMGSGKQTDGHQLTHNDS